MRKLFVAIAIASLSLLGAQSAAAQSFSDSTFPNPAWTSVLLPSSAPTATCTGTQDTTGNPAPSRLTVHTYPPGWVNCAHLSIPSMYDPAAQGQIVGLSYKYDAAHYTFSLGGVRYSPLVFQDNNYYVLSLAFADNVTSGNWTTFAKSSLMASDFFKLDGPLQRDHPDFSCTGSKIQFGYVTRNFLPSGSTITTKSGIDNWVITVQSQTCTVAPTCPLNTTPVVVGNVTYCCPNTPAPANQFCCCPLGSVPTTINGVTYCCQPNAQGRLCCTP
jgi:hypothetical protein